MPKTAMSEKADIILIDPVWVERRTGFDFEHISSIQDIAHYIMKDTRLTHSVSRIYLSEMCAAAMREKNLTNIARDDFISLLLEKYVYFTYEQPSEYYKTLRDYILSRGSINSGRCSYLFPHSHSGCRKESDKRFRVELRDALPIN